MQTKHLCVLSHIWTKGEVGAPQNQFKPSSKIFYWPFQGGTFFLIFYVFFCLCLLCLCTCLFICALWSPAGKGLTSRLSFVVSYCRFVTFPLVSWVRCGTWLYRFLILAPFLILILANHANPVKIQHYAVFHLFFTVCISTRLWVVSMPRSIHRLKNPPYFSLANE